MAPLCLADVAGPFYDPQKPFRNWSAIPYYQLDLATAPYVDQEQLMWGIERAQRYLEQIQAQGYTGIVIDNLAHMVTFDKAPMRVYSHESPYRQRALIYRNAFGKLFEHAAALGMDVFVTADMQWSTPPMRQLAGRLGADNQRLAALNRWALEELFTTFPQVRGLVVRVGETGGAHDQGSDYSGHMIYTAVDELRSLLDTLLPVCEGFGRLLVMRTWSIGIGELGDLMWSPERYREVFEGYSSPNLIVSIKHGPMDFFRMLPHNATLGQPGPMQLIEMQNRREYEMFGMVPSSVGALHQDALRHAAATNPRFAGVWAWNGSGGWGGGHAALGEHGWSIWTEISSALTGALVRDPELDTKAFVNAWCEQHIAKQSARYGETPQRLALFAQAVAELYLDSDKLMEEGWYLGKLTGGAQALGSLYLPTLLWVWWMRPTASLVVWSYLAVAIEDRAAALQGGAAAAERLTRHAQRLAAFAPAGDPEAAAIVVSARYFRDVLLVAHEIRSLMLGLLGAARSGNLAHWNRLAAHAHEVREKLRRHEATWRNNRALPPLELGEIARFLHALQRAPGVIWNQARIACRITDRLRAGRFPRRRVYVAGGVSAAALLTGLLFAKSRRGAGVVGALASSLLVPPLRRRALRMALPVLCRSLYLLPSIFFETGPAFTEWTT